MPDMRVQVNRFLAANVVAEVGDSVTCDMTRNAFPVPHTITFTVKFTKADTYSYACLIPAGMGMAGQVVVQEPHRTDESPVSGSPARDPRCRRRAILPYAEVRVGRRLPRLAAR